MFQVGVPLSSSSSDTYSDTSSSSDTYSDTSSYKNNVEGAKDLHSHLAPKTDSDSSNVCLCGEMRSASS